MAPEDAPGGSEDLEQTVGGGELIESAEAAEDEVRPKVPVASPIAPTASQLAEHRDGGHMPYRSWSRISSSVTG